MKETKIYIPVGYGVEKTEIMDDALVVTFNQKKPQRPKSWKEFCEICKIKEGEAYITSVSDLDVFEETKNQSATADRNVLPDCKTAKAMLALCQLIQLRECFNQRWKPNWSDDNECKYCIEFIEDEFVSCARYRYSTLLYFKSKELCDLFLEYFRDLIEELKPLYGITKGCKQ